MSCLVISFIFKLNKIDYCNFVICKGLGVVGYGDCRIYV